MGAQASAPPLEHPVPKPQVRPDNSRPKVTGPTGVGDATSSTFMDVHGGAKLGGSSASTNLPSDPEKALRKAKSAQEEHARNLGLQVMNELSRLESGPWARQTAAKSGTALASAREHIRWVASTRCTGEELSASISGLRDEGEPTDHVSQLDAIVSELRAREEAELLALRGLTDDLPIVALIRRHVAELEELERDINEGEWELEELEAARSQARSAREARVWEQKISRKLKSKRRAKRKVQEERSRLEGIAESEEDSGAVDSGPVPRPGAQGLLTGITEEGEEQHSGEEWTNQGPEGLDIVTPLPDFGPSRGIAGSGSMRRIVEVRVPPSTRSRDVDTDSPPPDDVSPDESPRRSDEDSDCIGDSAESVPSDSAAPTPCWLNEDDESDDVDGPGEEDDLSDDVDDPDDFQETGEPTPLKQRLQQRGPSGSLNASDLIQLISKMEASGIDASHERQTLADLVVYGDGSSNGKFEEVNGDDVSDSDSDDLETGLVVSLDQPLPRAPQRRVLNVQRNQAAATGAKAPTVSGIRPLDVDLGGIKEEAGRSWEARQRQQQQVQVRRTGASARNRPMCSPRSMTVEDALSILDLPLPPVDDDELLPSATELKEAYRKAAMSWHPDRPQNRHRREEATNEFQRAKSAFDLLMEIASSEEVGEASI
eukprot:gnl/TRDRNA2_/TRDRNA2_172685_c0_seq2.p1 gnl/TRDRNA2_/TRDRNA2_172685_c0~~gnl/TRDRNA2_/TRDRNA2_172685_c0_seq2.p1  ORF type:complete len:658 (-),score=140.13 gnl/TRDRNA2_/TRDRNA2_172685_c0_seq2:174-2147(-)